MVDALTRLLPWIRGALTLLVRPPVTAALQADAHGRHSRVGADSESAAMAASIVRNLAANKTNQEFLRLHEGKPIDILVNMLDFGPNSNAAAQAAAAIANLAVGSDANKDHVRPAAPSSSGRSGRDRFVRPNVASRAIS